MRLALSLRPALEMGALQAVAEVQDPLVEVSESADEDPRIHIYEGAVDVWLRFPNLDALQRFVRRVAALRGRVR